MPIKQPASVKETIQEAIDSSLYAPTIRNEYFIPDDLWGVEFDKDQISQVLRNLVLNAQEAMPRGGVITFSAENVLLDGDVHNSTPLPEGKYIKISIQDRGVGIPQKDLEKIFDPYFTTKPMGAEKGLGLGLAICHSIIRQHNGYISAESEVGGGATFHIYLPAP
jgi:signal transduction histidine kinase